MKKLFNIILISLLLYSLFGCHSERVDVVCTKIYQPVCWKGKLYSNQCEAERDGADNSELTPAMCIDYEPGYTGEMKPCPFCPE